MLTKIFLFYKCQIPEIKKDEFEKTTTMKIKRFAEIKKDEKNAI